jgi:hypothetical protein
MRAFYLSAESFVRVFRPHRCLRANSRLCPRRNFRILRFRLDPQLSTVLRSSPKSDCRMSHSSCESNFTLPGRVVPFVYQDGPKWDRHNSDFR